MYQDLFPWGYIQAKRELAIQLHSQIDSRSPVRLHSAVFNLGPILCYVTLLCYVTCCYVMLCSFSYSEINLGMCCTSIYCSLNHRHIISLCPHTKSYAMISLYIFKNKLSKLRSLQEEDISPTVSFLLKPYHVIC